MPCGVLLAEAVSSQTFTFHIVTNFVQTKTQDVINSASAVLAEPSLAEMGLSAQKEALKEVNSLLSLCIKGRFAGILERELRGGKRSFGGRANRILIA